MDYIREMLNASGRIMDTVNDAINRNDYRNLAKNIADQMSQYSRTTSSGKYYGQSGSYSSGKSGNYSGTRTYSSGSKTYHSGGQSGYRGGFWPQDIDLGTRGNKKRPSQANTSSNNEQRRTAYQGRTYSSNQANKARQNQNASSNAGKFTGAGTGTGYNAGQAYDARREQRNANWNYSASQQGTTSGQGTRPQGGQTSQTGQSGTYQQNRQTAITPFNQYKKKGAWTGGFLKQLFGGMGLVLTTPAAISLAISAVATGGATAVGAALMGAGAAGVSAYVLGKGGKEKKLANTFERYSKVVGAKEYASIEELAEMMAEDPEVVEKNLDEMISAGMLPQAKYDAGKTTVMFTKNAYDQYLLAEGARKEREKEEAELDAKMGSKEARKVITEGEAFVVKIKTANDLIPGQEMTDKLNQMERIVSKIFAQVRKDPNSADDLRKFMNYYLPTTEKLLNAYIELDKQPEVGENIKNTKREIEESVDTINNAFENLLDSLFQDVAWDISSDISVMKTMMEQDGLTRTKNDLGKAKAETEAPEFDFSEEPQEEVPEGPAEEVTEEVSEE